MTEVIGVEVARYRERDLLGKALEARGYTATAVEERGGRLGFDVECPDGGCGDLLHELELLVEELETPFIPMRGDGFDEDAWRREAGNHSGSNARVDMATALGSRLPPGTPRAAVAWPGKSGRPG